MLTIQINEEFNDTNQIANALEYIEPMIRQGFTSGHEPSWKIISNDE